MIFKCGLTWNAYKKQQAEWRDHFALIPRTVLIDDATGEMTCAWLQTIQVRSLWEGSYPYASWSHEYRLKPLL